MDNDYRLLPPVLLVGNGSPALIMGANSIGSPPHYNRRPMVLVMVAFPLVFSPPFAYGVASNAGGELNQLKTVCNMKNTITSPVRRELSSMAECTAAASKSVKSAQTRQNTVLNYLICSFIAAAAIVVVVWCVVSPSNSY